MTYVFGGLLVTIGAVLIGLAYHDQVGPAWAVLSGK